MDVNNLEHIGAIKCKCNGFKLIDICREYVGLHMYILAR
jgi:hypothetical protein